MVGSSSLRRWLPQHSPEIEADVRRVFETWQDRDRPTMENRESHREVIQTAADLVVTTVNKAAHMAASAEAGGIVISSTARDLIGSMDGVSERESRIIALKGLDGTHQVISMAWA